MEKILEELGFKNELERILQSSKTSYSSRIYIILKDAGVKGYQSYQFCQLLENIGNNDWSTVSEKIERINKNPYYKDPVSIKVREIIDVEMYFEKIYCAYEENIKNVDVEIPNLMNFYNDVKNNTIFKLICEMEEYGNLKSVFSKLKKYGKIESASIPNFINNEYITKEEIKHDEIFQRLKKIFSILHNHSKIVSKYEQSPEILDQEFINEIRKIGPEKLSTLSYYSSDEKMKYVCYLIIDAIINGNEVTEELLKEAMDNAGNAFKNNYFRILIRLYYFGNDIVELNNEIEGILKKLYKFNVKTFSLLSNQNYGCSWASVSLFSTDSFTGNNTNQISIEYSTELDNKVFISCYRDKEYGEADIFDLKDLTFGQFNTAINSRLDFIDNTKQNTGDKIMNTNYNMIYFGAPGSSKSYELNELVKEHKHKRVTFHSDYEYSDFVGSIKPVLNEGNMTYEFVPGIFTSLLEDALNAPSEEHYLVIEELTRGNSAGIFGDIFQLLDRDGTGCSSYPINNTYLEQYLDVEEIKLPNNFYIYATVNNSDQNVYPMDTAFKRRFDFKYFEPIGKVYPEFELLGYEWKELATKINTFIVNQPHLGEDKQIGAYFIKDGSNESIKKLLMYLWFDIDKFVANDNERITNSIIKEYSKFIKDDNLEFGKLFSAKFKEDSND